MDKNIKLPVGNIRVRWVENHPSHPIIVFLHDSFGCIELWRDFPDRLCKISKCNMLIYDRLGYGKSSSFAESRKGDYLEVEAQRLIDLLEILGIAKPILFGHSDGATIALITAAKYPDRILGVISEAAHIFVEEVTLKGIEDAVKEYETSNLKARLEKYHGDKTDKLFRAWADIWRLPNFREWNIKNMLSSIKAPTMVIQGELDEFGTQKQVTGILENVSGQTKELILPNVTHTPHHEAPDIVLGETAKFLKTHLHI